MAAPAPTRGRVRIEPADRRVRAYVAGELIADSTEPLYVWEGPNFPQWYLPVADVRTDLLVPSATEKHSSSRGEARFFTLKVDGTERVDAAWQYPDSPIEELRGYIRFRWDAIDTWLEEDEEVFVHPRSPYTRVEILPSSRPVRVEVDGVVLAETTRARVLYESGLPPRCYIPQDDVRMDRLDHTDHSSQCPYKGQAEYWSARVGDRVEENIAWSYSEPRRESDRIAGLVCFFNERVDLFVDGRLRDRPHTHFS
jgi:uncharacterized protein (DUF427 family)